MNANIALFLGVLLMGCTQYVQAAQQPGYVIEWGWNTSTAKAVPGRQVIGDVLAVSAGRVQCLALKSDGTVVQWGGNFRAEASFDKTILTTGEGGFVDKAGFHVTHPNTTTIVENGPVRVGGSILKDVVSVAAGDGFNVALKRDGTIACWGYAAAQVALSNIVAVQAGAFFTGFALKDDKTVIRWSNNKGFPDYGQPEKVPGLKNIVSLASCQTYLRPEQLALTQDGTVVEWEGGVSPRKMSNSTALSNIVAIAGGAGHGLAVSRDGTVFGWGFNNVGQATGVPTTNSPYVPPRRVVLHGETLSGVVSVAANDTYSMALKQDGTVVAWGRMVNNLYPATVPSGLRDVVAIAAGENFGLAITTNRMVAERLGE